MRQTQGHLLASVGTRQAHTASAPHTGQTRGFCLVGGGVQHLAEAWALSQAPPTPTPGPSAPHTSPTTQGRAERLTGSSSEQHRHQLSSAAEEATGRTSKLFKSRPVASSVLGTPHPAGEAHCLLKVSQGPVQTEGAAEGTARPCARPDHPKEQPEGRAQHVGRPPAGTAGEPSPDGTTRGRGPTRRPAAQLGYVW